MMKNMLLLCMFLFSNVHTVRLEHAAAASVSDRVQSENFNNRLAFFYVLRVMCECLRMTTTTRVDSVSRSDPKMDIRTSATKCVQGNHKTTVSIAIEHTHTLVYLLPDRRLGSHLIKTMRHCDLLERKRERAQRQLFCCCDHQQLGDMLRYTVACGTFFPY